VSAIRREFHLAKLLRINVKDWYYLREWLAAQTIDPFSSSHDTLLFIDKVKTILNGGMSIDEIRYLFEDEIVGVDAEKEQQIAKIEIINTIRSKWNEINTYSAANDVDGSILQSKLEALLPSSQAS